MPDALIQKASDIVAVRPLCQRREFHAAIQEVCLQVELYGMAKEMRAYRQRPRLYCRMVELFGVTAHRDPANLESVLGGMSDADA